MQQHPLRGLTLTHNPPVLIQTDGESIGRKKLLDQLLGWRKKKYLPTIVSPAYFAPQILLH